MATPLSLWIGTRKGAFVFRSKDRKAWKIEGPHFRGAEVNHVAADPREPKRVYAAVNSAWFGPHIHASSDGGKTWKLSESGFQLSGVKDASIKRVWHIAPGAADEPGVVWAGADPGALFRSQDWGENWEQVSSLTLHPTREKWMPGAGGMCLHSIQPLGKGRIVVAISAAGAFRSDDAGASWLPINKGLRSGEIPDQDSEVGHCVHHITQHPSRPDTLYMQKHWDVLRTDDAGANWREVSGELPSDFGFPIAVHAHEPETIYVVPIKSDSEHYPPEGKLRVYRSRTGGGDWEPLTNGLPQSDCYVNILRDAMAVDTLDPCGIYFGTTGGQVYHSADGGDSWAPIVRDLPAVLSVEVQVLP